jgi:hypothetical protein
MEAKDLTICSGQPLQCILSSQIRNNLFLRRHWVVALTAAGKVFVMDSPLMGSLCVMRDVPRNTEDPRKLMFDRQLIESAPNDHKRLVDHLVQVDVAVDSAGQVVSNYWGVCSEESAEPLLCIIPSHIFQCALGIEWYICLVRVVSRGQEQQRRASTPTGRQLKREVHLERTLGAR